MNNTNEPTAKLKAAAERQKSILAYIASYEPGGIDSDTVDLRFEDENGCDTGCDVSIVEECQSSAGVIDELIAALEAAEKRNDSLSEQLADCREIVSVQATGRRELRQRIAELEARKVKLPSINPQMFNDDVMFGYRKAQREAIEFCAAAGINLETGGEA
ncbi:hypothetical protein QMT25_20685 [Cronobacter dublinensis]|uniref:hypothetical protein n=1 Tax=Cronobacter dublinensis TaxID=413497 RepID=UPI0024C2914B|nr:hypothetical protein [Cronobacter dublinensis]MDK1199357.1 hypothetical protein [Cronobacter dublinensis]